MKKLAEKLVESMMKYGTLSNEDKGIYVSAGSACSSNRPAVSETLKAMKVDKDLLGSTIRFSFCRFNTKGEVDYAVEEITKLLPVLRKYVRR